MNKLNIELRNGLPVVEIKNEAELKKQLEDKLAAIRVISPDDEFGAISVNSWDGKPSIFTKSEYVKRWRDYVSQLTSLAVDNDQYVELRLLIVRIEEIAGERFMEMFKERHPEAKNTVINDEIEVS